MWARLHKVILKQGNSGWLAGVLLLQGLLLLPSLAAGEFSNALTEAEKSWLADHPVIRLAPDPQFLPLEFFDVSGNYVGMAADYVSLIENKLGIRFQRVRLNNWDEVLDQARKRQVDMWGAAVPTPQRLEYMSFTKPYLQLPAVVLVRRKVTEELTLKELRGMKVAIISGYGIHDYIVNNHPQLQLEVVPDIVSGLRKVSMGLADAMVANVALATYYIEKEGITNLRIAGESGFEYQWALASRKDWPELNAVLEKGLRQITPGERRAIYKKWINLERPWSEKIRELGIVALGFLVIFGMGGGWMWYRSMVRTVERKTADLKRELTEKGKVEEALRKSEKQYRDLFYQLHSLAQSTAADTGNEFFQSLAHHLALSFNVKYAFIGKLVDPEIGMVTTLAFWNGSGFTGSLTYEIKNTPCEQVIRNGWCSFPENVLEGFPEDQYLIDLNIESYMGIPILDGSGVPIGHMGVMDDKPITDAPTNQMIFSLFASRAFAEMERQAAVEDLLRAKDSAEHASQAKTQFLSRMSHELRTPLNAILGFGQLMQMRKEALDQDQIQCLDQIIKSGNILLDLINDVLDLSRIESQGLELDFKDLPVDQVVKNAIGLFIPTAREKGIEITNRVSDRVEVRADPLRLNQVLVNLVSNAIKYNSKNGTVFIEGSIIEESRYRLKVTDSGIGIASDQLKVLFEPFERLGKEFSEIDGTGIGLTISESLMKMMGGSIQVESVPGEGSSFIVELPVAKELPSSPYSSPSSLSS